MSITPKRDPRIDPKPGDVLRRFGWTRGDVTVLRRDGDDRASKVVIKSSTSKLSRPECLGYFRRAAENAEVINVAAE